MPSAPTHKRYASQTVHQRMDAAVKMVLEDGISQSEAARRTGVSRSRVNVNVKEAREKAKEFAERSSAATKARIDEFNRVEQARSDKGGAAPEEAGVVLPETEDSVEVALPDLSSPLLQEERRIQPPGEFIRTYFGNVICPDCGVHHEVPAFHDEILAKLTHPGTRRLLVNMAPYHSKSTTGTVYSTVYEICRNPNSRTAIVSKAERLAKNFLYQIKKLITDPDLYIGGPSLIDDWGPFHNSNHWSATDIVVTGRTSSEKDPTVSVYGVGALIYGYRFDRMLFDDIADLENQRNPERVAEMLQWATQECASRVGKSGLLAFLGTRVSPGDIYSHLQNLPAYETLRYPCITDEQAETTLWQDHFPYHAAVEQRDSMSLEQFQLVYQNVDTPGFGAAFPLDVLERCQDPTRPLGHWDPEWRLVLGVDPAGGGEQAGYTAMVVLAVHPVTGQRFIVDLINHKQMRAPQIKDQILAFADQYPLTEIRVEVNGLQSQIFQYDTELVSKLTQRGVRFVPHITHKGNKWDPQFGVEAMGPMFYNQNISVPWMDVNSRKKGGQLHEQLAQFPMGQINDLVMAMWFAELGCADIFQRFKLPAFDSRMRVPARIRNKRHVVDFGNQEVRAPNPHEVSDPQRHVEPRNFVNVSGDVLVY